MRWTVGLQIVLSVSSQAFEVTAGQSLMISHPGVQGTAHLWFVSDWPAGTSRMDTHHCDQEPAWLRDSRCDARMTSRDSWTRNCVQNQRLVALMYLSTRFVDCHFVWGELTLSYLSSRYKAFVRPGWTILEFTFDLFGELETSLRKESETSTNAWAAPCVAVCLLVSFGQFVHGGSVCVTWWRLFFFWMMG